MKLALQLSPIVTVSVDRREDGTDMHVCEAAIGLVVGIDGRSIKVSVPFMPAQFYKYLLRTPYGGLTRRPDTHRPNTWAPRGTLQDILDLLPNVVLNTSYASAK